jgi:hypothetical protein
VAAVRPRRVPISGQQRSISKGNTGGDRAADPHLYRCLGLLSFAQFEREVTGERIRDKIAASKAKGMWMGGQLPLGYDLPSDPATRALVVNDAEAEQVRLIFRRYLELGSVHALATWLASQKIHSKASGPMWIRTRTAVLP